MAIGHIMRALAGALFLLTAGTAQQVQAQNWDGSGLIRFGVFLQKSFADFDINQTPGVGPAFRQSASPDGFGFGISSGYDMRMGSFVVGAEFDVSFDDASAKSSPFTNEKYSVDFYSTLRGRFGYIFHPGFMGYFTIGYGMQGVEYKREDLVGVTGGSGFKKNATLRGLVYGGGLEYEMGWGTAFVEYLHADLGDWGFRALGSNNVVALDSTSDVVRLGMKFKVGHDHAHDVYGRSSPGGSAPMK